MSLWRKRKTSDKVATDVHHNEQKHDNLSNPLDLLNEQKPDHLVNILPNLSIKSEDLSIKSEDLSIKSEKAMREVQRLGQEIEIEYVLKFEDDDDIQDYKKPWVGLTDEEIYALESATDTLEFPQTVRAIEAKLKEKNT
jgi:hypothetical protein